MLCPTCNFLKYDGVLCGSPAMHGKDYCYHHTRQMTSAYYGARARRRRSVCRLALPALEDRRAIQHMLSQIVQALANDTIDYRRATAMLAALRMASADLDRPQEW